MEENRLFFWCVLVCLYLRHFYVYYLILSTINIYDAIFFKRNKYPFSNTIFDEW